MPFAELLLVAQTIIDSIEPANFSEETFLNLKSVFPENLVISAFDLLDRKSVIKYSTSWGHCEYEILGSISSYIVLLNLDPAPIPFHCTCPAFLEAVLLTEKHIMCKHILACLLAERLSLHIDRRVNMDELATMFTQRFKLSNANDST